MLLILEIALTVAAWRKGWGLRALLPLAVAFGLAFTLGVVGGASGSTASDLAVPCFLCDLGAVIALIFMTRRAPAAEDSRHTAPLPADHHQIDSPTNA
jgi:hypothetical protein